MPTGPHVSDETARQILQRAAEIDRAASDRVSIDTLRAAAAEAGITEAAFDAALGEQSAAATVAPGLLTRRRMIAGAVVGIVAAVVFFYSVGRSVERPSPPPSSPDTPITAPRR